MCYLFLKYLILFAQNIRFHKFHSKVIESIKSKNPNIVDSVFALILIDKYYLMSIHDFFLFH